MSFQLVCELLNEIETIVDVDRNLWFKTAALGKYLGIRNITSRTFHQVIPTPGPLVVR